MTKRDRHWLLQVPFMFWCFWAPIVWVAILVVTWPLRVLYQRAKRERWGDAR